MRATCFAAVALIFFSRPLFGYTEDWTIKGKIYHHVRVTKVNADTVSVTYDGGAGRLNLVDIPPEWQKRFAAQAEEAGAFVVVEKNADATDPIDQLVVKLSSLNGMWTNGGCRSIHLPKTASAEELVTQLWKMREFPGDKSYKILQVRQVSIDGPVFSPLYTAVLVQTNVGRKIVFFEYQGEVSGGWNRFYDSAL
jgi:hypothetical protein